YHRGQWYRHPSVRDTPPPGLYLRDLSEDLAEGPSSGPPTLRPRVEESRRGDPAAGRDRHAGPAWTGAANDADRRVADGLPGKAGDRAQAGQPALDPTGHQSRPTAVRSAAPADRGARRPQDLTRVPLAFRPIW